MTETYLLGMQCLGAACLYWDGFSCFLFQLKYEDYAQRMLPLLSSRVSVDLCLGLWQHSRYFMYSIDSYVIFCHAWPSTGTLAHLLVD